MSMYNLIRFDFVSIRLAASCAQRGRLTAARVSNLALATASRRIRELESAIGRSLFAGVDRRNQYVCHGVVPELSRTPGQHRRRAPDHGAAADAVLREIGPSASRIDAPRSRGIVGSLAS